MKWMIAFLLVLHGMPCFAQKWIDDNGKIYYGDPPQGINVREAPMSGGTMSSVGPQKSAPVRSNPATTKPEPMHPFAEETARARAQREDSAKYMRDNAAKFAPYDKDIVKAQREKQQERERQEQIRQRRQNEEICRATGRKC